MEISIIEKHLRPEYFKAQKSKKMKYVGIAPKTYFHLMTVIDDDYLSEWECFKFKTLFADMALMSYIVPTIIFMGGYYALPRLLGLKASGALGRMRKTRVSFGAIFGFMLYREFNLRLFPNRNFHELVTQPEPRGKYFRTLLKENRPTKWAEISKQLHSLGYNFREMNEFSEAETMPLNPNKFDNSLV